MKTSKKKNLSGGKQRKISKSKTTREGEPWIAGKETSLNEPYSYDEHEGTYVEDHHIDDDSLDREDEFES